MIFLFKVTFKSGSMGADSVKLLHDQPPHHIPASLIVEVFHRLVWCAQHAGQPDLVGNESHLASQVGEIRVAMISHL